MSNSSQAEPEENVKVLVALTDIEIGVMLEEDCERRVPGTPQERGRRCGNPILSVAGAVPEKRSPLFAINAGDMVRFSKLSEPGVGGKSQQIPVGMRVLTIPVDDTRQLQRPLATGRSPST